MKIWKTLQLLAAATKRFFWKINFPTVFKNVVANCRRGARSRQIRNFEEKTPSLFNYYKRMTKFYCKLDTPIKNWKCMELPLYHR